MVEGIRIYVEGDTRKNNTYSAITMRQSFHEFFKELVMKARANRFRFDIIPCGSRDETHKDFLRGIKSHPNSFVIFLVDSDQRVVLGKNVKTFLQENTTWRLEDINENQCHLMVQVMESWFLADMQVLEGFYGQNFNRNALPANPNIEQVPKEDVLTGLKNATRRTNKNTYIKTRHGIELLRRLDPQKVCEQAPHCKRLFDVIIESIG